MNSENITPEAIEFAGLQRVNYSKLPWEEKLTIVWGWVWRSLLVAMGTGMIAWLVIIVSVLAFNAISPGLNPFALMVFVWILGLGLGLVSTHPLVQWILNSRIGTYRILLCKYRNSDDITLDPGRERKVVSL